MSKSNSYKCSSIYTTWTDSGQPLRISYIYVIFYNSLSYKILQNMFDGSSVEIKVSLSSRTVLKEPIPAIIKPIKQFS